jgi:hypothetical protein
MGAAPATVRHEQAPRPRSHAAAANVSVAPPPSAACFTATAPPPPRARAAGNSLGQQSAAAPLVLEQPEQHAPQGAGTVADLVTAMGGALSAPATQSAQATSDRSQPSSAAAGAVQERYWGGVLVKQEPGVEPDDADGSSAASAAAPEKPPQPEHAVSACSAATACARAWPGASKSSEQGGTRERTPQGQLVSRPVRERSRDRYHKHSDSQHHDGNREDNAARRDRGGTRERGSAAHAVQHSGYASVDGRGGRRDGERGRPPHEQLTTQRERRDDRRDHKHSWDRGARSTASSAGNVHRGGRLDGCNQDKGGKKGNFVRGALHGKAGQGAHALPAVDELFGC